MGQCKCITMLFIFLIIQSSLSENCFEYGIDYLGFDISDGHYVSTISAQDCQEKCQLNSECNFWTWDPTYHNACWLKTDKNNEMVSGPKFCEDEATAECFDYGADYFGYDISGGQISTSSVVNCQL